jgi:hypothetical protein
VIIVLAASFEHLYIKSAQHHARLTVTRLYARTSASKTITVPKSLPIFL